MAEPGTLPLPSLDTAIHADSGSYLVADTVEYRRIVVPAPLDAAGLHPLLRPDAVLLRVDAPAQTSAIEAAVLAHVDGCRPVARIARKTGLSTEDLHVVIALLAAKGLVRLAGVVERERVRPAAKVAGLAPRRPPPRTSTPAPVPAPAARPALAGPVEKVRGPRALSSKELLAAAQEAEAEGDLSRAVELLRALLATAPSSAVAFNKLAVVLVKLRRVREAYDAALQAVELAPDNAVYRANLMKLFDVLSDTGAHPTLAKHERGGDGFFDRLRRARS